MTRKFGGWISIGLLMLASATPALAARFGNQFVEFELPPQWKCNLEGAEWVCQSEAEDKKRDAIIVLAAKLKGEQDSLDQYKAYLEMPKNYTSVQGKTVNSEPKYAKTLAINNHAWIDSLHLESEIPGFYTRYLATVKEDIGVLVTYSINKAKYQQYVSQFETMVNTLKVFRKPGSINVRAASDNLFDIPKPADPSAATVFGGNIPLGGADAPKPKQEEDLPFMLLVIGAAVVGFIIWRKRRQAE
ncbi:MAG: hypothetical protein NDJ89_11855 [Oligoflexia bacterium]|nr:hypothetical protein [Oligoflexia bacterium]